MKNFRSFVESISGTEDIQSFGAGWGSNRIPNTTLNKSHTQVVSNADVYVTQDMYQELYNDYLKLGGKPLVGFNQENVDIVTHFLKNKEINGKAN